MKSMIFAIALSSLLSLYNVNEATCKTLEEICSKTDFSKECSSALAQFIAGNNIDANAALLAGLKALEAETTKAINEAENLSKKKPTGNIKAAEELTASMAVYSVVSNSTKKAQEAIQANRISELTEEIKLASEVTGDLLDTFQEKIEGKNEVMWDMNVYIHQLAQNNFSILGMVMETQKNNQANQDEAPVSDQPQPPKPA